MGRNGLAQSLPDATLPQLYPWGCLTRGARGEQMAELADLAEADVVGFLPMTSRFRIPYWCSGYCSTLKPVDKPVALWGCDRILQDAGVAREGPYSLVYGLMGDPAISETAAPGCPARGCSHYGYSRTFHAACPMPGNGGE